jgi:nicotinamide mononucleotide (NMN) deamidase PncC
MKETQRSQERDADLVGAALKHSGRTLAVAESLTGGLLASAFARASGSSEWFRGGIVAYSSAVNRDLLDVPGGPVVSEVAAVAMARGPGACSRRTSPWRSRGSVAQTPGRRASRHRMGRHLT